MPVVAIMPMGISKQVYTQSSVGSAVAALAANGEFGVTKPTAIDPAITPKTFETVQLPHPIRGASVAISPNLQLLASASGIQDKTIQIWKLRSGELYLTLSGHTSAVVAIAFTADGEKLVSGSEDETINIWDLQTGAVLKTLKASTINNQLALVVN